MSKTVIRKKPHIGHDKFGYQRHEYGDGNHFRTYLFKHGHLVAQKPHSGYGTYSGIHHHHCRFRNHGRNDDECLRTGVSRQFRDFYPADCCKLHRFGKSRIVCLEKRGCPLYFRWIGNRIGIYPRSHAPRRGKSPVHYG